MNNNFFENTLNFINEGYKTANHTKSEGRILNRQGNIINDNYNKFEIRFNWDILWEEDEFNRLDDEMNNASLRNIYLSDCKVVLTYFMDLINDLAKKFTLTKTLKKKIKEILNELNKELDGKQEWFRVTCEDYPHYENGYLSPNSVEDILDSFKSYRNNIVDKVLTLQSRLLSISTQLILG